MMNRRDAERRPSALAVARIRVEWHRHDAASCMLFFFRGRFQAGKLRREN